MTKGKMKNNVLEVSKVCLHSEVNTHMHKKRDLCCEVGGKQCIIYSLREEDKVIDSFVYQINSVHKC